MNRFSAWLSLFASSGTLLCCALPSLLVALGMGAAMAGLVSSFPWLVELSRHKEVIFAGSALSIAFAAWMHWRGSRLPCPVDKKLAEACRSGKKWSLAVLILSAGLWAVGAFFAFLAPLLW